MPKKKKKSRSPATQVGAAASAIVASADDAQAPIAPTPCKEKLFVQPISDCLELRLVVPGSSSSSFISGGTKSLKYSPIVVLQELDADQLDVQNDDAVFALAITKNSTFHPEMDPTTTSEFKIVQSAIARVKIIIQVDASTPRLSYLSSTPNNIKSKSKHAGSSSAGLKLGVCQLFPTTLANSFFHQETITATTNTNLTPAISNRVSTPVTPIIITGASIPEVVVSPTKTVTPNPLSSTPPPTIVSSSSKSTSSKSKFSFAMTGSSGRWANQSTPSSVDVITRTTQKSLVWIVPADSNLGDYLSSQLLCKAIAPRSLQLYPLSTTSEQQPQQQKQQELQQQQQPLHDTTGDRSRIPNGPLAQRLVLATLVDNYINYNTTLSISIQGRKVILRVRHIIVNEYETSSSSSSSSSLIDQTHNNNNMTTTTTIVTSSMQKLSLDDDTTTTTTTTTKKEEGVENSSQTTLLQKSTAVGDTTNNISMPNNNNNSNNNHNNNVEQNTVIQALQSLNEEEKKRLLLYKITHDTKIDLVEKEYDEEDATMMKGNKVNGINDSKENTAIPYHHQNDCQPLVVGLDSVLSQIQSALEVPLLHPELFQQRRRRRRHTINDNDDDDNNDDNNDENNNNAAYAYSFLKPPKGVLLYGPSGVGKSALARQVAQQWMATDKFIVEYIHCTDLQSQTAFVGQAEQTLVTLFHKAAQRPTTTSSNKVGEKQGCLLILDDIHWICPRRQGTDLGADRLTSTLLALLDGIGGITDNVPSKNNDPNHSSNTNNNRSYPLFILAITTHPGMLDAAIRRPGRLDSEIEVPVPDEAATRAKILEFQMKCLGGQTPSNFTEMEWLSLACLAKGFTGADIKLAVKEALRKAMQGNNNNVTLEILEKAIRSVKPSAIKAVTVEIPRVPWSSIGGMENVKTQLREAIELPLTHAAMFQTLGIRPPRGVLLYGPPGCSKTLMARALATEGHMNFLAVKGPELLSKWLGESERALASLFRRARLASPAVIFFDEVDAIASKRGSGNNGGGERLLSQLLTELDGIQQGEDISGKKGSVVIVCATNRPDLLDGALMRPGRIDRKIYVGLPDRISREHILRIGLEGKSCANDIDWVRLAEDSVSGGLSGAELIAACRDAALLVMEEYEDALDANRMNDVTSQHHPMIRMKHLVRTLTERERHVTTKMLEFYASFQGKTTSPLNEK